MPNTADSRRWRNRLVYSLLQMIGWTLAKLPVSVSELLCTGLGWAMYRFSSRRHTILSGLERSFPERTVQWRETIARTHCQRMFEMFLLVLVLPHWSEGKIRRRFSVDASITDIFKEQEEDCGLILAIPHSVLMECLTLVPLLIRNAPNIITLYRELDQPGAEAYVHWARERWGARLVARRNGLLKAKKVLAGKRGAVALLFDQSSGHRGHLALFFDRVCSVSNLPGLFAAKTGAVPVFLDTRRLGFWRGIMEGTKLPASKNPAEIVVRLHQELERRLSSDDEICASWFWAHQRWKGPQRSHQILAFPQRKSYLSEQLRLFGRENFPRRTRFALRLDPRPGLLSVARRLLQVIRSQRPDSVFWLLAPSTLPQKILPEADMLFILPSDAQERHREIHRINGLFIDVLFSLDPSTAAVRENRRFHCEFSVGVYLSGTKNRYKNGIPVDPVAYELDPWAVWCERLPDLGAP